MKKIIALLLVLVLCLSVFAGCGSKNEGTATNNGTKTEEKTEEKKEEKTEEKKEETVEPQTGVTSSKDTLNVQISAEPTSLSACDSAAILTYFVGDALHEGLVKRVGNEIVPALAKDWKWSDDKLSLILTMRDDIKFSDGTPITAEDAAYSINFCRTAEFGSTITQNKYIEDVTADGNTVTIKLNQVNTPFLSSLTTATYGIMSKAALEAGMDYSKLPNVTSGPFYCTEWAPGEHLTLKANENYYEGKPPIDNVNILFMSDENAALIALEAGEIDIMTGTNFTVGGATREYLDGWDDFQILGYNSTAYNYLILNQDVEYFKDLNVRKAINAAINRNDIIAVALDGNGTPTDMPLIDAVYGSPKGYAPTEQNLDEAKKYMAASAYPNGFECSVMCNNATRVKVATVIKSELEPLGIILNIEEVDASTCSTNLAANNYETAFWSWSNSAGDISLVYSIYTPDDVKNYARWNNEELGNLLKENVTIEGDERLAQVEEIFSIIAENIPYIGLYFPGCAYAATSQLELNGNIGLCNELPFATMYFK